MAINNRIFVIAALGALALTAATYLYLQGSKPSAPPDVKTLLEQMPTAASTDLANTAQQWPERRATGRYDNMQRSGSAVLGRWATNIKDACIASVPVSVIPDEKAWKKPVIVYQCFDGATVFEIELE